MVRFFFPLFTRLTAPFLLLSATAGAQTASVLPTVNPAAINAGVLSKVTVSAIIISPSTPPISNAVTLLQVDVNGTTLAVLGTLNDSGINGDTIAGDGIFGGTFPFSQTAVGQIYLRVSAAFKGQLRRTLSSIISVQVVPQGFPTVPRPLNIANIVTDPASKSQVVCNELLVTFTPGTTLRKITATAALVGGSIVGWLPSLGIYQLGLPTCGATRLNAALAELQAQPDVASVQTNTIGQLFTSVTPNDPLFSEQWSLPRIQAPSAWSLIETGQTIGIIDSGIDYNHPDLANQVILGLDQCASLDANNNCIVGFNPLDTFGHGTGTASIAGATTNNGVGMAGVAFRVWLIAEKIGVVQGNQFIFTSYGVAYAIADAVDRGARVINLSLGTGGTGEPAVQSAISYALNKNAVVVAAAGNGNSSVPVTPASLSGVISVGASDENNQRADWLSECPNADPKQPASDYGSWVDLYAPGTNLIYATISGGYNTQCQAGTSWATPMVSGTASLMLSLNPSLTPAQVKTLIENTATNTGNTDGHGNTLYLLNTFAAAQQAAILPSQTVTYNYTGTIVLVEAQGFADPGIFKVGDTVSGTVSYQYPPPLPGVTQGNLIAYNGMIVSMSFYADGIRLLSGSVGETPPVNAAYIIPGTGSNAQLEFQYQPMDGGPNSLPFSLCSGGTLNIDFLGTSTPLGPAFPANLSPQTWNWSIMSGLLSYSNNTILCVPGWNAVYALVFNITSFTLQ